MSLGLGAGTFDAKQLIGDCRLAAIIEADKGARPCLSGNAVRKARQAIWRRPLLGSADVAGLIAQHHGDAIADGKGKAGGAARPAHSPRGRR